MLLSYTIRAYLFNRPALPSANKYPHKGTYYVLTNHECGECSRGLDKALIRSLGQGNWLNLKQNLLLTGATGSGKTYLACALGHNACRQGYKVYYYRLKALMDLCYQGHADGRYSKLLTKLNHSGLLLLDDWGLEPLSSEQRSDLLEIVDLMYQRGSIIVGNSAGRARSHG